jgi:SAM-dependent methyltransferase
VGGIPSSARPVRADVAESYDLGVDGYINVWSAVILPPAEAVVATLGIPAGARVLDVGGGTGALVPSIRAVAPDATVVAVDASAAMLRAARARAGVPAVQGDAVALPVRDARADVVLLAYVLFHVSDPGRAVAEGARALRPGGALGTVTWARESALAAYAVWDEELTAAGAPVLRPRKVDAGLDTPEAIRRLLGASGLEPVRVWRQELHRQWTLDTYWALLNGSGLSRLRLQGLDAEARDAAVARAHQRLAALDPSGFEWSGEVVCAVAIRPDPVGGS